MPVHAARPDARLHRRGRRGRRRDRPPAVPGRTRVLAPRDRPRDLRPRRPPEARDRSHRGAGSLHHHAHDLQDLAVRWWLVLVLAFAATAHADVTKAPKLVHAVAPTY